MTQAEPFHIKYAEEFFERVKREYTRLEKIQDGERDPTKEENEQWNRIEELYHALRRFLKIRDDDWDDDDDYYYDDYDEERDM